MREDRDDRMYEVNDLLDKVRTEFYQLLEFDVDAVGSADRERRRREVLHLVAELGFLAERL